ncbi:MAG: PAS domain S-box protein, partial [Actinobacteria bacterium]|nr:PAS domain S-box protein [Actinomycetota bacterium]
MFHLRERGPESILPWLEVFRDVAEVIDSAIVLVTPERRIVYMNKAAQQMWGVKEGSLCYRTLRNSRKVCSDCPLGGVIETSRVSRKEFRMHAADGWHTYEKLFIPLRGPYPHPQLVALLGTNIDYQKHLEQEVTREKELSGAILSAPSTFVIGVEANGRVEFVNHAWEDISGYSEREMIEGGGLHTLVPGEYRGEVDDYLSSMSRGAKPATRLVVPFLTKGGEEKIFSWTYSLVSGEEAGAEKAVMIGQDVTERARARIEVERRARELEVVNNILKNAGTSVAVEEMLDTTLNELLELPGYRCGVSYLLGDAGESGRRLAMLGFAKSEPPRTLTGIEGVFPATAVYNRKIEFAWPDIEMHPAAREILDGEGLKGIVAVPLVPGGRTVGMLLLGHDFGAERAEEDRPIIEAASEAFELGAENLFFRARAEGRAREATALLRVARSVTGEMALDRALERVVEEAAELFRVDICSIFLYDEETGLLSGKAGVGAEELRSIAVQLSESAIGSEAARTLKPVVVEDTEKDSRVPRFVVEDYGVRSSLGVPLVVEGRFAGALFLDMRSKRRYSQRELELIESFAGQAAIAIRSAFLLDDLRESEEKYRALVESAEDIVFTADTEGRITFVNEAVFTALEYMPEEIVGRDLGALNREEDREAVTQWLDRLLGGGRVKEERYRAWSKSGREVLLDISLAPLEVGGKVKGISGIARDVTEHVRAAEALRDTEEQSRALVESSLFGVVMHDGKNILYMNDRAVEMSGYSREEINSVEDFLNMLVPEEREEAVGRMHRRLAGDETPRVFDTRMRRKDGRITIVQVQNTVLTRG